MQSVARLGLHQALQSSLSLLTKARSLFITLIMLTLTWKSGMSTKVFMFTYVSNKCAAPILSNGSLKVTALLLLLRTKSFVSS